MANQEVIQELISRVSMDDTNFKKGINQVSRQLKTTRAELDNTSKKFRGMGDSTEYLQQKSKNLSNQLSLQNKRVDLLQKAYDQSKRSTGEFSSQTQNLATRLERAKGYLADTEQQLQDVRQELERQTNPWRRLQDNLDTTGQRLQNIGGQITSFGKTWTMGVTAPIVGFGGLMLKTGMDFEKSMSNVQAVSGATGQELEVLEDAAREMGSQTTKSASQAADGLSYMALAGWETQEMLEGLEPILRLSEAANIDLGRASDLVTDSMSSLRLEVSDLPQYLDAISEASRNSNTTIDQLMEAFLVAGGNLAQFNVPLDESIGLLGLMANRGFKGTEAGRALNAIMVNLTSGLGRAGEAMEELNIQAFDSDGNFIGLAETIQLVKDRTAEMNEEQQAQYISMIAGKEHLKTFQGLLDGVDREYGKLKESVADSNGALNEMAETMQDNAAGSVTRLKSAFEELSIQFSEHVLPAFTDIVEGTTDLVEWFGELDKSTQLNIIKAGAFAAALGPIAVVAGSATTAIGGILRVGGSLAGLLGRVGGAGLLGRLAGFGLGGPVGLAVGGLTVLTAGIMAVKDRTQELNDVSFEKVRQMQKEIEATDELINKFEELERQNRLTSDEMLEYMDLLDRISSTSSPQKLEELKGRQEDLLEQSGLTNEEMKKFIELNGEIIEQAPSAAGAISDQGNAYVDNLEALKELNQEKREEMLMTAERELVEALRNEAELMKEQAELEREKRQAMIDRQSAHKDYMSALNEVTEIENKQNDIQKEMLELQKRGYDHNDERMQQLIEEYGLLDDNRLQEKKKLDSAKEQLETAKEILEEKETDLESTNEQLKKIDELKYEYEALLLTQEGITSEKGQGIKALNDELDLLDQQKRELEKLHEQGILVGDEYRTQKSEIENQRDRLIEAKRELEQINDLAAKTAYEKEIRLRTNPSIGWFNRMIASDLTKRINLQVADPGYQMLAYADGTDFHPGGPAIVGEEGYEFTQMGNRWAALSAGVYDLPKGTKVFTHEESRRIEGAINSLNMPAYAEGISSSGDVNRVINRLSSNEGNMNNLIHAIYELASRPARFQISGREFIVAVRDDMNEELMTLHNEARTEAGL